jgi:tetratricopeptide (TPR) repeat protein
MSEMSSQFFKGIRGASFMLGVSQSSEPIYSKLIGVMRVENSQVFMANYEKYLQQYSELLKDAHSPILQPPTVEKTEIGGVAGLQITMFVPQPPGGAQMPQQARVMETLMGPGGKITTWLAPVDEHNIIMGYVSKEHMQQTIEAVKQGKPGLANDAEVSKTAGMLPSDAILVGYLSPQGMIEFIKRMGSVVMPPEMKVEQKIPEFPKTPPIGFAVTTAPNELQTCLVVPGEILLAVPKYIEKINSQKVSQAKTFGKEAEDENKQGEDSLKNEKMDEAITHFQKAIMLKPDYAEAHNNLGAVLFKNGRIQEAIMHFQQALRLNPDFAEAHYNLALAFAKTGRKAEAVASAQNGLELAKAQGKTEQAKKIEDWLKSNGGGKPE